MSLRLAQKVAEANTDYANWPFGCVITKGGAVQAVGWNVWKSDSDNLDEWYRSSVHCEVHALRQMNYEAKGCVLYICRLRKSGGIGIAKPCVRCEEVIVRAKIKKVVYTLNDQEYGVWKPNQRK